MKKLCLILLPILLIGLSISYNTGFNRALKTNQEHRKEILTIKDGLVPNNETIASLCPFYTINGGNWSCSTKTILIEEVDKSQITSRVSIIDKGKILFYSHARMKMSVDPVRTYDYGDAFIVSYSTDKNSDTAITRDFYKEVDGEYKLVKTIDANTKRITYYAKVKEINEMVTIFYLDDPNDKYSWYSQFYVSPISKYGNNDSKKWSDLVSKNINSSFKITGVNLENHDCNLKLCYVNLYVENIEIVK